MAQRTVGDAAPRSDEWRLFVALDVGAAAREAIRAAQEQCRREGFPLRPVDAASAHLTLRFLGATDPARVPALGAALRAVAAAYGPFTLHTAAPGAFPNLATGACALARPGGSGGAPGGVAAGHRDGISRLWRAARGATVHAASDARADSGGGGTARPTYRRAPCHVAGRRRAAPGDGASPVAERARPWWRAL